MLNYLYKWLEIPWGKTRGITAEYAYHSIADSFLLETWPLLQRGFQGLRTISGPETGNHPDPTDFLWLYH